MVKQRECIDRVAGSGGVEPVRGCPCRIWFLAARPKTLWAAVAPVMIGTGMAYGDGGFHLLGALAALLGALLIQIGTNFCNDYVDFKKGADTVQRIGPVRATQSGWVTPRAMLRATVMVFVLVGLVGVYLVYRGGGVMLAIGVLSVLAGIGYTAGPYALAYLGLGDLFVFIFFGPVAVGGTYYIQTLQWPVEVTVAGIAPGLLSCAILVANNLRDVEEDRVAQKRTLAVRYGERFSRGQYLCCLFTAILVVPVVLSIGFQRPLSILCAVFSLAAARTPLKTIRAAASGTALNPLLGQTARILFIYSLLFTAGEIYGSITA